MKKANLFYIWFVKLGGNVSRLEAEEIIKRTNTIPLTGHGFGSIASEIKSKYNHKFEK